MIHMTAYCHNYSTDFTNREELLCKMLYVYNQLCYMCVMIMIITYMPSVFNINLIGLLCIAGMANKQKETESIMKTFIL